MSSTSLVVLVWESPKGSQLPPRGTELFGHDTLGDGTGGVQGSVSEKHVSWCGTGDLVLHCGSLEVHRDQFSPSIENYSPSFVSSSLLLLENGMFPVHHQDFLW